MVGYEVDGVGSRLHAGSNPLQQSTDFGGAGLRPVGSLTPSEEVADLAYFAGGGI